MDLLDFGLKPLGDYLSEDVKGGLRRVAKRRVFEDKQALHLRGDDDARLSAAIVARLNLRKLLFTAGVRMRQRTKQDLDAAAKCLARAASERATVRASAHLGALQGAGVDDQAWAALGFDPGLSAHLAPPAPPRVVTVRGGFLYCHAQRHHRFGGTLTKTEQQQQATRPKIHSNTHQHSRCHAMQRWTTLRR